MMHHQTVAEEHAGRWRALTLLALTLVLSMSTWFSAPAVIPTAPFATFTLTA